MKLLGAGDNVVDRYHDLGRMFPGGNALNVAVAAARAGAQAAYLGAVGTDRAGDSVLAGLHAEGVDTSHVRVIDGPNAYADVMLVEGDRVFVGADIGVSRFRLDSDDLAWAATFDLVHTGDCSMLEDQVAELAGVAPVSFDFSIHRDPPTSSRSCRTSRSHASPRATSTRTKPLTSSPGSWPTALGSPSRRAGPRGPCSTTAAGHGARRSSQPGSSTPLVPATRSSVGSWSG